MYDNVFDATHARTDEIHGPASRPVARTDKATEHAALRVLRKDSNWL